MMSLKYFSDTPIKMAAYNVYVSQYKNGYYNAFCFQVTRQIVIQFVRKG